MKTGCKRLVALALSAVLLIAALTACDNGAVPEEETTGVLANGNVNTAPAEVGTEEELTAVRENLIKATETKGLGDITKMEFYENGVRTASDQYVQVKDNKKFYYTGDTKRLVNYPDGYILDMPADWAPDFTLSTARCVYENDEVTLIVSDEENALELYGTPEAYLEMVFRFVNTETYYEKNRVTKLLEETFAHGEDMTAFVLKLCLEECLEGTKNYYTYVVFYNELKITHMMFKCIDDRDLSDVYLSYQSIYDKGAAVDTLAYPEGSSESWNEETEALYESIKTAETVQWGLVHGNIENDPLRLNYMTLENQLDHKFPIVTSYTDQLTFDFPVEDAQKISDDGRYIQFTYHFDYSYGNTMGQNAPILDVYRGELDEEFREFAKQVVEYGQPMLFRLNNEMNSDWTSWAAVNAMLDPDIFTATWIRMYEIFEEEGANQYLIWVWNPQSANSAPHTKWNDLRLYMPGAKYVDMLGLTSYNFGNDEVWNSFETLYQWLEDYYSKDFGDWAWIIAEFGCSDSSELEENENRKAEWITAMFDCFEQDMFPNIKAAVWFNANDYDGYGNITHEIALGRDPASIEAFRDGLERTQ